VETGLAGAGESFDEVVLAAAVGDFEVEGVEGLEELVAFEPFEDLALGGHHGDDNPGPIRPPQGTPSTSGPGDPQGWEDLSRQ